MDELKMIKELRSSTPAMPTEVENSVRRRLHALASAGEPARSAGRFGGRQAMVRVGLVGALAAAAAGVVVVHGVGDFGTGARPTSGSTAGALPKGGSVPGALPDVQLVSAEDLGDRAALAAWQVPYEQPGPKQWVYIRQVQASGFNMNTWEKGVDVTKPETSERWTRVDDQGLAWIDSHGELTGLYHQGNIVKTIGKAFARRSAVALRAGSPEHDLRNIYKLPTTPDALLRYLYKSSPNDELVFQTMSDILRYPLPPRLQAAVYRALPKIPGVVLQHGVLDAAGRRGVAFAMVEGDERDSIILDPVTYRYLGAREEIARTHLEKWKDGYGHPHSAVAKAGTVLAWYAIVDQKIVDKPGQRS
jgi:hypothetical protein